MSRGLLTGCLRSSSACTAVQSVKSVEHLRLAVGFIGMFPSRSSFFTYLATLCYAVLCSAEVKGYEPRGLLALHPGRRRRATSRH